MTSPRERPEAAAALEESTDPDYDAASSRRKIQLLSDFRSEGFYVHSFECATGLFTGA